jgi:DNA replicative helicase MCM subunit Mcm2 (Cdc46/Mcm family)
MPNEQHFKIRNLSVQQISNLISIKGLVLRVSEIIPLMVVGKFVCS